MEPLSRPNCGVHERGRQRQLNVETGQADWGFDPKSVLQIVPEPIGTVVTC